MAIVAEAVASGAERSAGLVSALAVAVLCAAHLGWGRAAGRTSVALIAAVVVLARLVSVVVPSPEIPAEWWPVAPAATIGSAVLLWHRLPGLRRRWGVHCPARATALAVAGGIAAAVVLAEQAAVASVVSTAAVVPLAGAAAVEEWLHRGPLLRASGRALAGRAVVATAVLTAAGFVAFGRATVVIMLVVALAFGSLAWWSRSALPSVLGRVALVVTLVAMVAR